METCRYKELQNQLYAMQKLARVADPTVLQEARSSQATANDGMKLEAEFQNLQNQQQKYTDIYSLLVQNNTLTILQNKIKLNLKERRWRALGEVKSWTTYEASDPTQL